MALPKKLFKTTVTIWTEYHPNDVPEAVASVRGGLDSDLGDPLVVECESGYCGGFEVEEVTDPSKFPDTEFFGVEGEGDDRPERCQNPPCQSGGMAWSHTHLIGNPEEAVWAWVCDTCGCVQEKHLYAAIQKSTGKVVEGTSPVPAYSLSEAEEVLVQRHREDGIRNTSAHDLLLLEGTEVVPLTDELEAQYPKKDPDAG